MGRRTIPLFCNCPPEVEDGTLLSHYQEVLAGANDRLEIRDRRHGTTHRLDLTIHDLVGLLDPLGTSYQPVGSAR